MLIKENYLQRFSGPILFVYWIVLFISTHIPIPELNKLPENSDKVMHFVAYAGLSFLFFLWRSFKKTITFPDVLMITGLIAIYANLDELLQKYFNRFCDPYDVLADWAGIAIGFAIFLLWQRIGFKLFIKRNESIS